MAQKFKPETIYCQTAEQALLLASSDDDGKAMTTGVGTLAFHRSLAQHGSGLFTRLYVPAALRGKFMEPAGGSVKFIEGEA